MREKDAFEQLLVRYSDGDLDADAVSSVERKLAESADARRILEEYRASLLRVREAIKHPTSAEEPNLAGIESRAKIKQYARRAGWAAAVCAGAVLIWLTVIYPSANSRHEPARMSQVVAPMQADLDALNARLTSLERQVALFKSICFAYGTQSDAVPEWTQWQLEEVAAVCVAAGENLQQKSPDIPGARARYEYAVRHFPETKAAAHARLLIARLNEGPL